MAEETGWLICDTDVLIDYYTPKRERHALAKEVIDERFGIKRCIIPYIVCMEMLQGNKNKLEQQRVRKNLFGFQIVYLDEVICRSALSLFEQYHLSHGLQVPDSLVAATAVELGMPLFTFNTRDFRFISGLNLYRP